MTAKSVTAITTTVALILVGFVSAWEGLSTRAYRDAVNVPTICYGHTAGVKMGDQMTKAQCDALLIKDLEVYAQGLDRCIKVKLPDTRRAALISFTYNVGVPTACRSSVVRLINQGRIAEGCNALLRYNKAGKPLKALRGLTNRREAERKLCLLH